MSKPAQKRCGMLVLSRRPGEKIFIGNDIVITVVEFRGGKIRIGIEAPKNVAIYREEIAPARDGVQS